ncbi:hypothetical protein [Rhodococcus sp. BL-253-APC-6A1W]|uniref:hypothetical protein n=1 Tax=Rhodococcus sp. BL-253-APC-6A1W TaxID=2725307 RepID=UPI001469FCC1|nr:hypothetical protein [Rhodococcus sp. BL-253-APC-6A1W]
MGCTAAGLGAIAANPDQVAVSVDAAMATWTQVIESRYPLIDPAAPPCYRPATVNLDGSPNTHLDCMTQEEVEHSNRDTMRERELLIAQKQAELAARDAEAELEAWRDSRKPDPLQPVDVTPR